MRVQKASLAVLIEVYVARDKSFSHGGHKSRKYERLI